MFGKRTTSEGERRQNKWQMFMQKGLEMKQIYKRNIRRAICLTLLISLFLTGCGRISFHDGIRTGIEEENEKETKKETEKGARAEIGKEREKTGGEGSAELILSNLAKDEGFRERVWYDAGITEGDTKKEVLQKLEQCEHLTLREPPYGNSLFSLEDLSLLPNLKSLSIIIESWDDSRIEDFTPIAGLSNLEQLYISYDTKEEIELFFLSEMGNITELYLPNCQIKDVAFLKEMPQLERLSLYGTPVQDLSILEELPGLVELALGGNADAQNLEAVGKLSKMQDLGLQECGITDIGFLSSLTELRGVNLNGNFVTDLTPLAGLTRLERLGAAKNHIKDISPLAGLSNLYDLALDGNEISDISALSSLSRLNQAGLSDNQILDLSPLADKKELMYAAVFGNPCADLEPVYQVPLLYCMSRGATKKEAESAENWVREQHPEITKEYKCIDYAEGDLNQDGRTDIAFVIEGEENLGDDEVYDRSRLLFVLLNQENGSLKELKELPYIWDRDAGGMRGDPYDGIFLGEGYLMLKQSWGSSGGGSSMEIYSYHQEKLELAKEVNVEDYNYAEGYDVTIQDTKNNTWLRYVIAMDDYRMVRVDIEDSEHPSHKAFPNMSLYDRSYYVYNEKLDTSMDAADALDNFQKDIVPEAEKLHLPYAFWQKAGYELLTGTELPDYYYAVLGTEKNAEGETSKEAWQGDYIYYDGLIGRNGQLYHVIYYVTQKNETLYLLNDDTGEIQKTNL